MENKNKDNLKNKIQIELISEEEMLEEKEITCSFCGRKYSEELEKNSGINFLMSEYDEKIGICDVCLDILCETNDLLREKDFDSINGNEYKDKQIDVGKMEDYTPKAIKDYLDEYVIGQEEAKRALAIAAYNHIKRVNNMDMELSKTNVLLVGPSGCGKTYLVETLSKLLKVPCVSINITAYSETGYKGKDPIDILRNLYYEADENIELAERGIIFIDEVDKIASVEGGHHIGDTKIQQSLLKMIEGYEETISDGDTFRPITLNTKNILFIFAGAFVGLEKTQKGNQCSSGFISSNVSNKKDVELKRVLPEHLISFGMIPEFVGRVQKIVTLKALNKHDLISIMKNSKDSACLNYKKLFSLDGFNLEFDESALEQIADECIKNKLGARALKSVIEDTMEDLMFNGPTIGNKKGRKKKILVTKEMVVNRYN